MRLKSNRAQVYHLAFDPAGRAHEDAVRALFQFDESHFFFNELVEAAGSADLALEYTKVGFDQPVVASVIVIHGMKKVDPVATGGRKVDLPQGGVALVHPGTDQIEVGVITKLFCKKLCCTLVKYVIFEVRSFDPKAILGTKRGRTSTEISRT